METQKDDEFLKNEKQQSAQRQSDNTPEKIDEEKEEDEDIIDSDGGGWGDDISLSEETPNRQDEKPKEVDVQKQPECEKSVEKPIEHA